MSRTSQVYPVAAISTPTPVEEDMDTPNPDHQNRNSAGREEDPIDISTALESLRSTYDTFELGYIWGVAFHHYRDDPDLVTNLGVYLDNIHYIGNLRTLARMHRIDIPELIGLSSDIIQSHIRNPLIRTERVDLDQYFRRGGDEEAQIATVPAEPNDREEAEAPAPIDPIHNENHRSVMCACTLASIAVVGCIALAGVCYTILEDF